MDKSLKSYMNYIKKLIKESSEMAGMPDIAPHYDERSPDYTLPEPEKLKKLKEIWEGSEKSVDESAPPGFPKKLYNKIKKEYPGNSSKAYATMWKMHKQMKENFDNNINQVPTPTNSGPRPLSQIANDIRRDWKNVNFAAKPYLDAMYSLDSMKDMYGADSASSVVAYFLSNASSWKGPVAKQIKLELNKMLKSKREEIELAETTGTGAAPGYSTPFAFSGGKSGNEKRRKQTATVGSGYKIVGDK